MFYEGTLQNGVTAPERLRKNVDFPWPAPDTLMFFYQNLGREEISSSGTSFLNKMEASNVEKIVTKFFNVGVMPSQIGVVTPYEGQRSFKDLYKDIEVASVDAFHCVRSNDSEHQGIGFLNDPRRLNVALTHVKYRVVILINPKPEHYLLTHYKENNTLVEGPLNNLQASMIQFSKPRRSLVKSVDKFRRHETNAQGFIPNTGGTSRSGTPSRFDSSFYRTHDALGYIPYDVQSLRSQATYSSGLPMFAAAGGFGPGLPRASGGVRKRSAYGSYASPIISQDAGSPNISGSAMAFSQLDRLQRRGSFPLLPDNGDSRMQTMEGAHWPHFEHPQMFNGILGVWPDSETLEHLVLQAAMA
ncbi:AAA domain-containing protein [Suillus clintonianus]|uniref:AAA domain-containing protein n=1 Tax=Suillus clintonianus TaxID=1904413 RepID=UPI001B881BDE|nr:AAA domain-containing protein [Suillus clintonianus]KAG2119190.1 AAA domain-containing protein [Suillus clintonianus]